MTTYNDDEVSISKTYSDSDVSVSTTKEQPVTEKEVSPTIESLLSGAIGGLPAVSGGVKKAEEALPAIGQLLGSRVGIVGSVLGAGTGSTLEELVKVGLRGKKVDLNKIGGDTAVTALIEGISRGAGNFYFRREIANQTINSLGRKLGSMKEGIAKAGEVDPTLSVPKDKIVNFLDDVFKNVTVPFGKASVIMKRWQRALSDPKLTEVSPKMLMELEDDLGNIAKFATQKIGGAPLVPEVQKKALNSAAKSLRSVVSDEVDTVATKAGFKDFGKVSKQISKLKKEFPSSELKKGQILPGIPATFLATGSGVLGGVVTGNPTTGLLAGLLVEGLQSPAIRELLFNTVGNKAVSTGARIGLSDLLRKSSGN